MSACTAESAQPAREDADRQVDASPNESGALDAAESRPGVGYASWRMPNPMGSGLPNEQTFEQGENTAADSLTGVVWERGSSETLLSWDEANARCEALELDGRSDFHLPTRIEWVSVIDVGRTPTVPAVFLRTAPEYHWSASSRGASSMYTVYLGAGETAIAQRVSRARVRCVAGGNLPLDVQFERTANAVRDRATRLSWQLPALSARTKDEAASECAARSARLPSLRELQTLVDESREPALDPAVFSGVSAMRHWTSTLAWGDPNYAWTVDVRDGQTHGDARATQQLPALCVTSE